MRKIILFCFSILYIVNIISAQEIQWIITEDAKLKLYEDNGFVIVNKKTEITPQKHTSYEYQTDRITYIYYNNKSGDIDSNVIIPKNSKELFSQELTTSDMVVLPYYNFDILHKSDRSIIKDMFHDTFESLKGEWYTEQECYDEIIKNSSTKQLCIKNAIVTLSANNEQNCWLYVNEIKKINNGYKCEGKIEYGWEGNVFLTNPTKGPHSLLILFDGDYINVYEDSKDKLLMTYAITDEKTLNEFNNLIITGDCDLSKVTWPRHADGTSLYDNLNKPAKFNFNTLEQ